MNTQSPLISFKNLTYHFVDKTAFAGAEAHIYLHDKICLIGRNGSGKTTLLKLLAGEIEPDGGNISSQNGIKIGYFSQDLGENPSDQNLYQYVLADIADSDLENYYYLADQVLLPLGLQGEKPCKNLSGGKLRRLKLAKILLNKPDILLLDEPTNHLDIDSILWLQGFVKSFGGAIVFTSHDRAFAAECSQKMWWIDEGILRTHNHSYSKFNDWQEEILLAKEREYTQLNKNLQAENIWLQQGVTARRKRNQRRLHNLYALREEFHKKHQEINRSEKRIADLTTSKSLGRNFCFELENLGFSYQDITPPKEVIKNFSARVLIGEKIGLIGRNGAGKTSLIKLLIGELQANQGTIKFGHDIRINYIDQKRTRLDENISVLANISELGTDYVEINGQQMHVTTYLQYFNFHKAKFNTPVSKLSGGEKNRLTLAKMLLRPADLLILDEPTNDLDLETINQLEDVLLNFKGTVLIVSHDREFLNNLTTRSWVYNGSQIEDHLGGFDFATLTMPEEKGKPAKKPEKKVQAKESNRQTKLSYKEEYNLENLPTEIEALTSKANQLAVEISKEQAYEKLLAKSQELEKLREEISDKESLWYSLLEKKEKLGS